MAAHRPELYTKDEVLAYYTETAATCYRVYVGMVPDDKFCRYQYMDETNKDGGYEKLRLALENIAADSRNTNPYVLECILEKVPIKRRGGVEDVRYRTINIGFKLNDDNYTASRDGGGVTIINPRNETTPALQPQTNEYANQMFAFLKEQNEMLRQELQEQNRKMLELLEQQQDFEEEPTLVVLTGKEKLMGAIGSILESEQMQSTIPTIIGLIASKFLMPKNAENANN